MKIQDAMLLIGIRTVLYKIVSFAKPLKFVGFLWTWQARSFVAKGAHMSKLVLRTATIGPASGESF
jgi:hypothetical protein